MDWDLCQTKVRELSQKGVWQRAEPRGSFPKLKNSTIVAGYFSAFEQKALPTFVCRTCSLRLPLAALPHHRSYSNQLPGVSPGLVEYIPLVDFPPCSRDLLLKLVTSPQGWLQLPAISSPELQYLILETMALHPCIGSYILVLLACSTFALPREEFVSWRNRYF